MIVAMIKKNKGVLESPKPLKMALMELYPKAVMIPRKVMSRYSLASGSTSGGVFSKINTGLLRIKPKAVIVREAKNKKI